jgi:hypothetical protein
MRHFVVAFAVLWSALPARPSDVSGTVVDPNGRPVHDTQVTLVRRDRLLYQHLKRFR